MQDLLLEDPLLPAITCEPRRPSTASHAPESRHPIPTPATAPYDRRRNWPLKNAKAQSLVLAILLAAVLHFTVFGRYVFAIGSNEATARLCGINVRWNKIAIYTLGGLFVGIAVQYGWYWGFEKIRSAIFG